MVNKDLVERESLEAEPSANGGAVTEHCYSGFADLSHFNHDFSRR